VWAQWVSCSFIHDDDTRELIADSWEFRMLLILTNSEYIGDDPPPCLIVPLRRCPDLEHHATEATHGTRWESERDERASWAESCGAGVQRPAMAPGAWRAHEDDAATLKSAGETRE
jgi:hypothetical protein